MATRPMVCENELNLIIFTKGGVYVEDNPFQRVLPFNLIRLAMFFAISSSLHYLFKPLKQSEYVCNLLTGIILGSSILGRFKHYRAMTENEVQAHFLNVVAEIGLLYYLFTISVKIDFRSTLRAKRKVWFILGTSSVTAPLIIMMPLLTFIPLVPFEQKIYAYIFAIQLSCTSFTNLAPMLEEFNLLTTEMGQLLMSIGLSNEIILSLFGILNISFLNITTRGFLKFAIQVLALAFSVLSFSIIVKWVTKRMKVGEIVSEIYIVGILLGVLVMAGISDILVGSGALGVIFLGFLVPNGPPLGSAIIGRCEVFIKYCLLPFFFLGIGDMIDIHKMVNLKAHLLYEVVIVIGYATKSISTMLVGTYFGIPSTQGFALGLAMNTSGVLHVMLYWGLWLRQRLNIDSATHQVLGSLVISSLVVPLALHYHKHQRKADDIIGGFQLSIQGAISMGSRMQILACVDSEEDIPIITTFLKLSGLASSHTNFGAYIVHLTELDGQVTPMLLPHKKHKRICRHNGCIAITTAIRNHCQKSQGLESLQFLTMVAPFPNIHETVANLATEKMIPLVIVPISHKQFFKKKVVSCDFNGKLQKLAPCTIGILVDRNITTTTNHHQRKHCYHIAVIFYGGKHDREALAYAIWMANHYEVDITLVKVTVKNFLAMYKGEKILDEIMVQSFITSSSSSNNNNNKSKLVYQEMDAEDWLSSLDMIKALENDCDLVMVGQRHAQTIQQVKDMSILDEYPELGHVGELLVTDETHWKNVSILVMQHSHDDAF